ncbi:MAG: hypothetical protein EZS28_040191, partial [Streblomastix strix]
MGKIEIYEKKLQLLQKKIVSNAQECKRKTELKELQMMEKRFMETHKASAKSDLEKLKKDIEMFTNEMVRYDAEVRGAQQELQGHLKSKESKNEIISRMNMVVDEATTKMKGQQNMLDTVTSERNI